MPTGGVQPTDENLKEWLSAGAHCVGLGSQLFIKNNEGNFDYEAIKETTKQAVESFKKYKK
ncbi:keto-hydroxyglutarate-aldolase/keto-deoxy-phosphogluconate aldolase [compost metagenome]